MKKRWIGFGLVGAVVAGTAAWAAAANDVAEPDFTIISQEGDIEVRQYEPMIVAETTVTGERDKAMNSGFRTIADFIFGNNKASQEVAMTSPVTQQRGEAIAMTAPVLQQETGGEWKVRFVMPAEYTMATLPRPNNPDIEILEVPQRKVAAIRFSGRADRKSISEHEQKLLSYLAAQGLSPESAPTYAFYDAPWVPGMMRRNEVLIEVSP